MQNKSPSNNIAIVAVIGRPNVGKSTLFNRITRSRRAIVDASPGVTRDRHYDRVVWLDRTFILVDTGGIDIDRTDSMTDRIREQSLQAVEEADLILFMLDGREGPTPLDHEIADLLRKTDKPVFHVVNKIDSPELEQTLLPQFYELGAEKLWPTAAEHGHGINSLMDEVISALGQRPEPPTTPAATIRLAFIGRPNVGKSSLINRLLGEERMVVSSQPGTTRDAVDTLLTVGNNSYLLIDTAGIRRKGKVKGKLEKFSILRALSSLERCDIALLLIDAEEGITEQDTKVIGYCLESNRACLLLVNKWDLVKGDKKRQRQIMTEIEMATQFVGYAPTLTLSAVTGAGIKKIMPVVNKIYQQYTKTFSTNLLNRLLQRAIEAHSPSLHQGRRIKFYYTTQVAAKPPTFVVFTNYPKAVHFSYHRYLTNKFREDLGLDKTLIRILFKERKRKTYT